ncbi:serine/threonine-protein kinase [Streptomyces sp. NPDC056600]|uniref:serine/threonine-protein kinase n=1 Tax=Streptomyces sp. NPDC056600 TaxID=3345874 RepID=UPI0036AE4AFD
MGFTEELGAGDPERVGPYRLVRRLGAGGMGRVYLARSKGGRAVAVKVVRPELAEDREFRQRFAREVAAARRVNGVFTAGVVDADPEADPPWLATAYVPGVSLDTAVALHGAWEASRVTTLAVGLAEALEAIHASGLVHRDLKPSNVLLAADGPRVIDFGISTAAEASVITRTGVVIGTPGFMSPEQLTGEPVTAASDVFALGAVLAFAASGAGPFGTGSAQGLMYRVVHAEPDLAAVPDAVRGLVGRCLAKRPQDRPGVGELLAELTDATDTADAAGAARTELLFAGAAWLPPAVAATVRQVRDGTAAAGSAGQHDAGDAPLPPTRQAPTVTAPARSTPSPAHTPTAPPTDPPAYSTPAAPPTTPPSYTPTAVAPGAGDGGARAGGSGGMPPGRPPGASGRRRAAVIVPLVVAALAAGLVAWQADALFGGASGTDSGSSAPPSDAWSDGQPEAGPTPSDTASPSSSPSGTPYDASSSTGPPADAPSDPSPSPSPSEVVTDLSGRWNGSYVCNQGITGLVLTVDQYQDGSVTGVFAFYPAPSNPTVPRGSFAVAGTFESGVLTLRATNWIEQPPGYLTVDLQAAYDPSAPGHMDGRVYGANCTTFSADRT